MPDRPERGHIFNETTEALLASMGDQIRQTGNTSLMADWITLMDSIRAKIGGAR